MGKEIKDKIKIAKYKKNGLLMAVLFSGILLAFLYIVLIKIPSLDRNIIDGIFLVVLLVFTFLVYTANNKITFYSYEYNYYLMVYEDLPAIKPSIKMFDNAWEKQIIDKGFSLHEKNSEFAVYYMFTTRKGEYKEFGRAMVGIVINYEEKLDLYGQKVQHSIKKIYEKNEKHNKTKTEVLLQFKKYQTFDSKTKSEIQRIITFKQNNFSIINITIGYFNDSKMVYYLRPEKRFPNKHYYFACKLIESLI